MFCTSCGAELPEGARFCSKCGAKVTPPVRAGADGGTGDGAERETLSDTGRNPDIGAPIPADVAGSAASSRPDIADDGEGPAVDDGTVPGKRPDEEAEAGAEPVGPIDETPDAAKPFAKKAAATRKRRGFAATMIQFRRTTLRAVPTFVLAIIAFLAAAATAYALFRVATDIIIPAIEQAQQVEEKGEANEAEGSGESGAEASDNEAKEDAEEKKASYSVRSVEENVTVTANYDPSYSQETIWRYPQFSSTKMNDKLDTLNENIKKEFDNYKNMSHDEGGLYSEETGEYLESSISYEADCTYLKDNIACIHKSIYTTRGGPHGDTIISADFYDLDTGNKIEIAQALDLDFEQLKTEARNAMNSYLASNPDDTYDPAERQQTEDQIIADPSRYYVTDHGIVVIVQSYELGIYALGHPEIVVRSFDDAWQNRVGTALSYEEVENL